MAEGKPSVSEKRMRSRSAIALLFWIAFIFATSSTVIRPREFFSLVEYFTGADQATINQFRIFWGVSWFVIVKGWHFTEFAILTVLAAVAIAWWRGSYDRRAIVYAMLFCFLFAISDEWHQSFVPDRFGTLMDVMIDSAGVLTAGICMIQRKRRQSNRQSM